MKKRILVVDDHPIIYQGLLQMISEKDGITVIGNAQTYDEAIDIISGELPDLVIVDIGLKSEKNGLDLVKELSECYPMVKTMVLSMHEEEVYAKRAAAAGARGYVNKSEFTEKITDALSTVLGGQLYFLNETSEELKNHEVRQRLLVNKLTPREFEILRMIGQGYENEEIAVKLELKSKTIQSHKLRIRNKLRFQSGNELIRVAVKWVTENRLS